MTRKDYEAEDITVHWEASRCIHAAICLRAAPEVFDTQRRPWIDVSGASAERIAEAVAKCPTGALTFSSPTIAEPVPAPTRMRPIRGGPMVVNGAIELVDADGNVVSETRAALCRCGNSGNQPYCDNSHRTQGFDEQEFRAPEPAESPGQICDPQPGF